MFTSSRKKKQVEREKQRGLYINYQHIKPSNPISKSDAPEILIKNGKLGFWVSSSKYYPNSHFKSFDVDHICPFRDGIAKVNKSIENKNKCGFIDMAGHYIVEPILDVALSFREGLAVVCINDKYGFINEEGKIAIPLKYNWAGSFHEGVALVCLKGEGAIYINKYGSKAIHGSFYGANLFSEGLAGVCENNKYGFIDKSGKYVIPPVYDSVGNFMEGYAPVTIDNKSYLIDKNGTIFVEGKKFHLGFQRGFLSAEILPKIYGIINREQKVAEIFTEYLWIGTYSDSEGLFHAMNKNGRGGFINEKNEILIPFKYSEVWAFSEGVACVQFDSLYGFIDKYGQQKIPFIYNKAMPFKNGIAYVEYKSKCGIINKNGEWIREIEAMEDAYCYFIP